MDEAEPLALLAWQYEQRVGEAAELADLFDADISVRTTRVTLDERIRGWIEAWLVARFPDGSALAGRCLQVGSRSLLLATDGGTVVVRLEAPVNVAADHTGGQVEARGQQRLGVSLVLRDWRGSRIEVASHGQIRRGILTEVGADHLLLTTPGGVELLPWGGVWWVRRITPRPPAN